jgi:hypothetical protein
MAKKLKRQTRKDISPLAAESSSTSELPTTDKLANFNPDYTHVIQDLRRIGILAGSFVVILVILSFFLH